LINWLEEYARGQLRPTKRKVYFAFRYKDIMRANNVRHSGKIGFDEEKNPRDFYDRSIWEKSSSSDPETLKRLMREGVEHSSVVCVLNCTDTWESRWVKYEIARAVIDNKGLLTVGIAGLRHHQRGVADQAGLNPLSVMGISKNAYGTLYLYENRLVLKSMSPVRYEWEWRQFADHTAPVTLPRYLSEPQVGYVTPLANGAKQHDYVTNDGGRNLGSWVDAAAKQVGR
jgi:MTH538 TIR-like domain (DUF1863)